MCTESPPPKTGTLTSWGFEEGKDTMVKGVVFGSEDMHGVITNRKRCTRPANVMCMPMLFKAICSLQNEQLAHSPLFK